MQLVEGVVMKSPAFAEHLVIAGEVEDLGLKGFDSVVLLDEVVVLLRQSSLMLAQLVAPFFELLLFIVSI